MAVTYEPIASQTLGSAVSSVTFSDIPQTFTDLIFIAQAGTAGGANSWIRYNGDTGTNYSATMIRRTGTSTVLSTRRTNESAWLQDFQRDGAVTADIWQVEILNYTSTSVFKTGLGSLQSTQWDSIKSAGLWRSTAAITSLSLYVDVTTFLTGSTFSLYGIKAA